MLTVFQILYKTEMFHELEPEELSKIVSACLLERVSRGRRIHDTEESGRPLVAVGHGLLKTIINVAGNSTEPSVVRLHAPGDLANEVQILDPRPRALHLVAAVDSTIVRVPRALCLDLFVRKPKVAMALARSCAKAASEAYARIAASRFSAETRIAATLLQLADDYGDENEEGHSFITLPLKRTELAGYVGMTVETLIRTMSAMRRAEIIAEENGHIKIIDRRALENASVELRAYNVAS